MSLSAVLGAEKSFGEGMSLVEPELRSSPLVSCMAPPVYKNIPALFWTKLWPILLLFLPFGVCPGRSRKQMFY
jgi:hypothetical protein